ncbi:hypothetical protein PROCH_0918 [Prochlorococcus marinus str. EQPAC1]|nr:hypothetical protein PROCH_0918 [Prochlorococcus marinus str. EQPAC1]
MYLPNNRNIDFYYVDKKLLQAQIFKNSLLPYLHFLHFKINVVQFLIK